MRIVLSIPPSLNNRMYRNMRLTKEYRWWKSEAAQSIARQVERYHPEGPCNARFAVGVDLYWGDKRRRDIDNFGKPILDAITESEAVWLDDSQVDELSISRIEGHPDDIQMDANTAEIIISVVGQLAPF